MKKIFKSVVLIAVICCAAAVNSAAGEYMFDNFGDGFSQNWNITPKIGTIEINGHADACVRITIPNGKDGDAFLQTKKYIDGRRDFAVSADMRYLASAGNSQVVLRDSYSSVNGHFISIARLEAERIYYLPDFLSNTKYEAVKKGETCRIEAVFEPSKDTVTVYRNSEEKAKVTNMSAVGGEKWKNFIWSSFGIRIQAARIGAAEAQAEFDNVLFHYTKEQDGELYAFTEGFGASGGKITATVLCKNTSAAGQAASVVVAHYRNGILTGVSTKNNVNISAYGVGEITVEYPAENFLKGDTLKIMALESFENMRPIAETERYTALSEEYTSVSVPRAADLAMSLNRQRPRVITSNEKFEALRKTINSSPSSNQYKWYQKVEKRAKGYLTASMPTYEDADAMRLTASGAVFQRVKEMAFVYLIGGDEKYAEKIWDYMELCAEWPDWGDNHFLNTSDMCAAYGLAYDWLYNYWTPQQRKLIGDTLMEKGLLVADEDYNTGAWWTTLDSNWTAVCNGGVAMGAAALMDDYEMCEEILVKSLKNVQQCYVQFAPDGGWYEGVGYWEYATRFWAMMMSTMEASFGSDFGHHLTAGLEESAMFPMYMTGTRNIFNFSDAGETVSNCAAMFYLGNKFDNKYVNGYRLYQLDTLNLSPDITDIIWYDKKKTSSNFSEIMKSGVYYSNIETAVMRNGFAENTKSAVVLHGGENDISHSHLDAGHFFYEAEGVRWALDLGSDAYNLYMYCSYSRAVKNRWCYYRVRAEGHNTWVINPKNGFDQLLDGGGIIEGYNFTDNISRAVVDLTSAYSDDANAVKRGIEYDKSTGAVLIRDELDLKKTSELYWFMHTKADITLSADKKSAVLTAENLNGETKRLWVGITDGDGVFEIKEATPLETSPNPDLWTENQNNAGDSVNPKTQNSNEGISKLAVHYQNTGLAVSQSVYMIPLKEGEQAPQTLYAAAELSQWELNK